MPNTEEKYLEQFLVQVNTEYFVNTKKRFIMSNQYKMRNLLYSTLSYYLKYCSQFKKKAVYFNFTLTILLLKLLAVKIYFVLLLNGEQQGLLFLMLEQLMFINQNLNYVESLIHTPHKISKKPLKSKTAQKFNQTQVNRILFTYKHMSQLKTEPNRQVLWQNSYPTSKFVFELCFLIFTLCLWSKLIHYTISYYNQNPICVVAGFIIAQFLVDYVSGMLHWACDTWGHFQTPIVGPTLIRAFRMHHVDPQDITKHGFVETNASSCYPMPFFIAFGLLITPSGSISQIYEWTIIFGVVLGILTNQIHKWAHMVHSKPHPIIRFLQQSRLILSHEQHHRHHQNQFDKGYCIINGWMNPFLEKIDYWRKLQNLITKVTGAQPRSDDVYWRPKYK